MTAAFMYLDDLISESDYFHIKYLMSHKYVCLPTATAFLHI